MSDLVAVIPKLSRLENLYYKGNSHQPHIGVAFVQHSNSLQYASFKG
jgi:hypothetical protein